MVREDAYDEARHNLQAARARLTAVEERTRGCWWRWRRFEASAEQHPRMLEAKAALDAAALELSRTRVTAPLQAS